MGPSFVQKPGIRQAGENIIIECKLKADPKPDITWRCGDRIITDDGRFRTIHTVDGESHLIGLEIGQVSLQDGGEYKVQAKNEYGESTATITLNLGGEWGVSNLWMLLLLYTVCG